MAEHLLAKSESSKHGILTVKQHLLDTEQAATEIFRLDKRWGRNWCRFFKISDSKDQEKFLLNLRVAALFHDLGKANEEFQTAVAPGKFYAQSIRHEHLSALVLLLPEVQKWLKFNPILDIDIIIAAVLSHHLQVSEDEWCKAKGKLLFKLYFDHDEVKYILRRIQKIAQLEAPPELPNNPWTPESIWQNLIENSGLKAAKKCKREMKINLTKRSLILAVKAGVMVADAVASAKFRENLTLHEWFEKYVHTPDITSEEVKREILQPFAEDYERRKNKKFELWDFQKQIYKKGFRVLLMTACGSGKTQAAWEWLKQQCDDREVGKLIFLYPTRATALQGFLGYAAWGGNNTAHLSGTAQYELETLRENPTESTKGKDYHLSESEARLFALGYWGKRYFSGTVDQFMSFLEHNYRGLCLLPVLADSAIVLDEVHSYDQRMFSSLIAFLREFDIPVLCMTATLPSSRKAQLLTYLEEFPTSEERSAFKNLQEAEDEKRYQIEIIEEFEVLSKAVKAYQEYKYRVLWVVNQVAKCQNKADELEQILQQHESSIEVISYHSQFLLCDRQKYHRAIVKQFSSQDEGEAILPAIAVTTQVCEMSLDLDADLLITEFANVCALVQRFGRANRHLSRGKKFRAKILVYMPKRHDNNDIKPYTKEEIKIAEEFLDDLANMGDLSQSELAEKLEFHAAKEPLANGWTRFLSEGYYATPGDYRDITAYRKTCVLDRDILGDSPLILSRITDKKAFDDLIVSIPNKKDCILDLGDERPDWLPKWLGVAPANRYCPKRGFRA